jgi:hypothetical protein
MATPSVIRVSITIAFRSDNSEAAAAARVAEARVAPVRVALVRVAQVAHSLRAVNRVDSSERV